MNFSFIIVFLLKITHKNVCNQYISKLLYVYIRVSVGGAFMQVSTVEIEKVASLLKLLGDKNRLTMVKILDSHDCCVCEFVEIFNISQPAISQHLRKLKDLGIVKETRRGQWIFYSLNKDSEYYPLVKNILQHLPSQDNKLQELEEQGLRISCN